MTKTKTSKTPIVLAILMILSLTGLTVASAVHDHHTLSSRPAVLAAPGE